MRSHQTVHHRLLETPEFSRFLKSLALPSAEQAALIRLFWLLNLNPHLIAHNQVFENLIAFFSTRIFSNLSFVTYDYMNGRGATSAHYYYWPDDLKAWLQALKSITTNTELVNEIPGLYVRRSKTGGHPMYGHGITRHPVAAALWSRHQTHTHSYPPPPDNHPAYRYFLLQAQVCLAHMRCRSRTDLSEFLTFSGPNEHAPVSATTQPISVAIRDCHSSNYDGVIFDLHPEADHEQFLFNAHSARLNRTSIQPLTAGEATATFNRFKQFLNSVRRELAGERTKRHGGLRAGRAGGPQEVEFHPGCHPITQTLWLYSEPGTLDDVEDGVRDANGTQVIHFTNGNYADEDDERLVSGLDPTPKPAPVLTLYFAHEIGGALQQARFQMLARESHQQRLRTDYQFLSENEHRWIDLEVENEIAKYFSGKSADSHRAEAALMLLILRTLGVTPELARSMQILDGKTAESPERIALIQEASGEFFFSLPSLEPIYAANHNFDEELNRPRASRIFLKDYFFLGSKITRFVQQAGRTFEKPFRSNLGTFRRCAKQILKNAGDERLTIAKLRHTLEGCLRARSRDPVIGWMLTADQSRRGEPRLYHTRYDLEILQRAYRKAALSMARTIGKPIIEPLSQIIYSSQSDLSVGARFVLGIDVVRKLVAKVAHLVRYELDENCSRSELIEYHNNFVVQVCLMQSLLTTYRAVNDPDELLRILEETKFEYSFSALADKDNDAGESARLVPILDMLMHQYKAWNLHVQLLLKRMPSLVDNTGIEGLFALNAKELPTPITRTWIEERYAHLGFRIPANFHRAFLRSTLITMGSPVEVVDTFMGHSSLGESPFGERSTFSYRTYRLYLFAALEPLAKAIGLKALESKV